MESHEALLFLIWIFMSTMIGTVSYRSRARDIFSIYEDKLVCLWSLAILMTLGRCPYSQFVPLRIWNKDPRQETHQWFIENMAWPTTIKMHNNKCQENYCMPYNTMEDLVEELHPFLESQHEELVNDQVDIRKVAHMIVYQLAHGNGYRQIADMYGICPSIVWKYVQIVVNNLSDATRYSIYDKYITIPMGERLQTIIDRFYVRIRLPNICGAIDGIQLVPKSLWPTLTIIIGKNATTLQFRQYAMQIRCSRTFVPIVLEEYTTEDNLRHHLWTNNFDVNKYSSILKLLWDN